MRFARQVHSIFLMMVLLPATLSLAASAQEEGKPAEALPEAEAVLGRLSGFTAGLDRFRAEATMLLNLEMAGEKRQVTATYVLAAEKPNKLWFRSFQDEHELLVVSDGAQLYTHISDISGIDKYRVADAPATLEETLPAAMRELRPDRMVWLFHAFFQKDPAAELTKGVRGTEYLGREDVDGKTCDHVRFSYPDHEWNLWIEVGDSPFLWKTAAVTSSENAADMRVEERVAFTAWAAGVEHPARQFVFAPPESAEKVTSFFARPTPRASEASHPLLGKPAPDFTLGLLNGGTLDLAQHKKENDIVVLDFWATWCPPCRRAMPLIAAISDEYKGKGVKIYFVNQGESENTVRTFLKSAGLNIAVAMDEDGAIGDELYKAVSIPQTVLIGKDGVVEVVHTGIFPGFDAQLRGELDALIEGKKLAGGA